MDQEKLRSLSMQGGDTVKQFLSKYNAVLQPLMFVGGFAYDSLTITRIDSITDNIIFGLYLIVLAFIHWLQLRRINPEFILGTGRIASWITAGEKYFPFISQFLFGGLMSAYVIFYFQSAADVKSFIFLLVLVFLLIGNEFFEKRYQNRLFFYAMYFFALFSWLLFLLPALFKHSNTFMFYLALFFSFLLVLLLVAWAKNQFSIPALKALHREAHLYITGGLMLLLIIFYHSNWIPPVPLSMKKMGIYTGVDKKGDTYIFQYQEPEVRGLFRKDYNPRIYWRDGDAVYSFASVFAPGNLRQELTHHWYWQKPGTEEWILRDTISYVISGGRAEGWRGYTYKQKMFHGKWRVDVKTPEDKLVGRIGFEVVFLDSMHRSNRRYRY